MGVHARHRAHPRKRRGVKGRKKEINYCSSHQDGKERKPHPHLGKKVAGRGKNRDSPILLYSVRQEQGEKGERNIKKQKKKKAAPYPDKSAEDSEDSWAKENGRKRLAGGCLSHCKGSKEIPNIKGRKKRPITSFPRKKIKERIRRAYIRKRVKGCLALTTSHLVHFHPT